MTPSAERMPRARVVLNWWLVLLVGFWASGAIAAERQVEPSVHAWIKRMNMAIQELGYKGRFVHQRGDTLETLEIAHWKDGERRRERLVTLDGMTREVLRDGDRAVCSLPHNKGVVVESGPRPGGVSPLSVIQPEQLERFYDFRLGELARIAGRDGQIVEVVPKDDLRFGYQLVLDRVSGLPLRTEIRDQHGGLVSRVVFTELLVGEPFDPPRRELERELAALETSPGAVSEGHVAPARWRLRTSTDGFLLKVHRRFGDETKPDAPEHYVFSDGLATVSVYVFGAEHPGVDGETEIRGINAYGAEKAAHRLVAVGEVPHRTLVQLVAQLEPIQP